MSRKLRAALILLAALCIVIALYYPVSQYIEGKTLDDEMNALRRMKASAAAQGATPEPAAAILETNRGRTDRSVGNADTAGETTDRSAEKTGVAGDATDQSLEATVRDGATANPGESLRGPAGEVVAQSTLDPAVQADPAPVSGGSGAGTLSPTAAPKQLPDIEMDKADTENETAEPNANGSSASASLAPAAQLASTAQPTPAPTPFVFDENKILPEYKPLYEQNRDMVGWLKIEGTMIDYPVLQRQDEEYYLTRDFYGNNNSSGQLILDAQCDPFTPDPNLVISGHDMKSGKMFGTLQEYASKSFGLKHPIIEFDTLFRRGQYKLVAAFYAWDYQKREDGFRYNVDIRYRLEMLQFLKELDEVKLYDTGVPVAFGDPMIMLSTCSHQTDDSRFVVVARRLRDGEQP